MSTKQEVSTVLGPETGPQSQVPEVPIRTSLGDLTIRTELKSERVQEPQAASREEMPQPGFILELAVQPPQPVTLEVFDPKVTITLHGAPAEATKAA